MLFMMAGMIINKNMLFMMAGMIINKNMNMLFLSSLCFCFDNA